MCEGTLTIRTVTGMEPVVADSALKLTKSCSILLMCEAMLLSFGCTCVDKKMAKKNTISAVQLRGHVVKLWVHLR
jgi:hypothetical protein